MPLGQRNPLMLEARGSHDNMVAIARLKPGISIAQAQSEMSAVQDHLDQLYPGENRGLGIDVEPAQESDRRRRERNAVSCCSERLGWFC